MLGTFRGDRPPQDLIKKPITPDMARALETLELGSLERFRVGYARDFHGPFILKGTLESLRRRGLVDITPEIGRAHITRKGRQALAAWRARAEEAA